MILVVAERSDDALKKTTFELLAAAREIAPALDYEIAAAVLGDGLDGDALAAAVGAHGAELLFLLDDPALAEYAVEPYSAALQQLIEAEEPALVLLAMSPTGRELAPRLAGRLDAGLASDVTGLEVEAQQLLFVRPIYSGQVMARTRVHGETVLATLRPNTWSPAESGGGPADLEPVTLDALPAARTEVVEQLSSGGDRPDLAEAGTIISGGRGMGGPENFPLVEELADLLGAAVGTTRAVVDAGWRPYEEQVGQTGKTVSPQLYVALGISGALQHLSGMRTSKTIVAVNKDPDAPIFRVADYGIVADLFDVLPVLKQEIERLES